MSLQCWLRDRSPSIDAAMWPHSLAFMGHGRRNLLNGVPSPVGSHDLASGTRYGLWLCCGPYVRVYRALRWGWLMHEL